MRNWNRWIAGGVLLLAVGITLSRTSQAQTPKPPASATLTGDIATTTKLDERDVDKVLRELGPAIAKRLARGEKIDMPGLGTFRVVRIPAHNDLVDGKPTTIPTTNNVEFLAAAEIVNASNAPDAVPAAVVPPFQYNILPDQTPGQKVPNTRVPSSRIK